MPNAGPFGVGCWRELRSCEPQKLWSQLNSRMLLPDRDKHRCLFTFALSSARKSLLRQGHDVQYQRQRLIGHRTPVTFIKAQSASRHVMFLSHVNTEQDDITVATFPHHLVTENELIVVFYHADGYPSSTG